MYLFQATQPVISSQCVCRQLNLPQVTPLNLEPPGSLFSGFQNALCSLSSLLPMDFHNTKTRSRDCPVKPLQPTSKSPPWAFHSCLDTLPTEMHIRLFLSCASSILSSQGTLKTSNTICLIVSDIKMSVRLVS